MPPDLQFIDANINNYQNIPSSLYPVLNAFTLSNASGSPVANGIGVSNIVVNRQGVPTSDPVPDTTGISITWLYPNNDNLYLRVAVAYQLQLLEGTFSTDEVQSPIPPGNIDFEQIINLNVFANPNNFVNLQNGAAGKVDIPSGSMKAGQAYTARIRTLVFSELGAGTIGNQYFKYTEWRSVNFRINNVPQAVGLRVNSLTNPVRIPSTNPIAFSFTFSDTDGPFYLYRIQIGTTPGLAFAANVWDSGLIAAGSSFGPRDFTVNYSGSPLSTGVTYYWRVNVQDGLVDGGFTAANDSFSINVAPTVPSIQINGNEILFGNIPAIGNTGAVLTWQFADFYGDAQRAYNLSIVQTIAAPNGGPQQFEILVSGDVFSTVSSINLPVLPVGGQIHVTLKVRDSIEFSRAYSGSFNSNSIPQVLNLKIAGAVNPGNVATATPAFSWTFFDDMPGDFQHGFRVQVATSNSFSALLWDSGLITSTVPLVVYGSTPSPIVAPAALTHGSYYYVQVQVYDGISLSDFAGGFFAINTAPNSPTLLTPSAGAFSGILNVTWMPASPLDADGDTVTYTLEMTSRRSSNQGWNYLAGPFASNLTLFPLDLSTIKSGNDYGIRILANDGFADSDPTLGTSPVNANGLGFTIQNHPPTTPIFIQPVTGTTAGSILKIEWLEGNPVDIDGDTVFYLLEMTRDASVGVPVYETLGVFQEGTTGTLLDISSLPDGSHYMLRITASDDKGAVGAVNYSPQFSIINTPAVTDFETLGTNLYISTSDGRVFKAVESIWQLDENFESNDSLLSFDTFVNGTPATTVKNGLLNIQSPQGSTFILRIGQKA